MSDASIELILCDVGGVLGSNGWDHNERAAAAAHFGFDYSSFQVRHEEAMETWEMGQMTMAEYLDFTVFNVDRPFTREEFGAFMMAQSVPNAEALQLMSGLAAQHRWRMMTVNNESAELNAYRIETFGLRAIFDAFLTSAYVAARKPHATYYDRVLAISHADPARTVFIDDRLGNIEPVRARGVHCIHATDTPALRAGLDALGITSRNN